MSIINSMYSAAAGINPFGQFDALGKAAQQRATNASTADVKPDIRERMSQGLNTGEERALIDATKDIAANLFNAFRNELRNALSHVGIDGNTAADLIKDVSNSFAEAVRGGSSFSFGMIAAAYQETIIQTGNAVSHSLEFSASALSIEYNHATGELTADTSTLEIDAFKYVEGNSPPMPAALFDFTDSEGPAGIADIFASVEDFLIENGFVEELEDADLIEAERDLNEEVLDAGLLDDTRNTDETDKDEADSELLGTTALERLAQSEFGNGAFNIQSIEQFTNARQENVTRLTFDLFVQVKIGQTDERAAPERAPERPEAPGNRRIGVTV